MSKEADIMRKIQVALSKVGARVLRNNTGALKNDRGDWVKYGLGVGSSDLIGWTPVKITPEMVNAVVAVFTAIEVKTGYAKATPEQEQFISAVIQAGGIAGVARSEQDAIDILG